MDVKRLFKDDPPKRPLTSLDAIVRDWTYRFGRKGAMAHRRDMVVEYCRDAPSFAIAVARACESRDAQGKMHNHQTRVRATARDGFAAAIVAARKGRMVTPTFDELYDHLAKLRPWGIGDVTLYDIAVRIGAYLKVEPSSLYLHAGVREAWDKLHGRKSKDLRIPFNQLPKPLQKLPADEVEDCLCTYRELIQPWEKKT